MANKKDMVPSSARKPVSLLHAWLAHEYALLATSCAGSKIAERAMRSHGFTTNLRTSYSCMTVCYMIYNRPYGSSSWESPVLFISVHSLSPAQDGRQLVHWVRHGHGRVPRGSVLLELLLTVPHQHIVHVLIQLTGGNRGLGHELIRSLSKQIDVLPGIADDAICKFLMSGELQ